VETAVPSFDLYSLLLRVPPLLFALTIHEFAHAGSAYLCGDPTAKDQGRLTLHPLVHLDPIGTLCLLFAPFGWARPVPVNPLNFRHPRRDDILVSLAGVAANLATALLVAVALRLALQLDVDPLGSQAAKAAWTMAQLLVVISLGLMLFNLIPVPPLDGSHVLKNLLPRDAAVAYERSAPITSILFLMLILTGAFGTILGRPLFALVRLLLGPAVSPWLL
jgi:Zn-dependent protease